MRKYAMLKTPMKEDEGVTIYKIMLYASANGIYLFEYDSMDAEQCVHELYYESVEAVYDDWSDLIDANGWIELDDPLPHCQHDAFLPIRIKGRNTGKPEWGKLEIYEQGEWRAYKP